MAVKEYTIEETEPTMVCEPEVVSYGAARMRTDRSQLMTIDEFYDYCMKRIDEIYG